MSQRPFKDWDGTQRALFIVLIFVFGIGLALVILATTFPNSVANPGNSSQEKAAAFAFDIIYRCTLGGGITLWIPTFIQILGLFTPSRTGTQTIFIVNICFQVLAVITITVIAIVPLFFLAAVTVFCTSIQSACYECPNDLSSDECSARGCWYREGTLDEICISFKNKMIAGIALLAIGAFLLFVEAVLGCIVTSTIKRRNRHTITNTVVVVQQQQPQPTTVVYAPSYAVATPPSYTVPPSGQPYPPQAQQYPPQEQPPQPQQYLPQGQQYPPQGQQYPQQPYSAAPDHYGASLSPPPYTQASAPPHNM